jgi:hypothetical protein
LLRERGGSDELRDNDFKAAPREFPVFVMSSWGFPRQLGERLERDPTLASLTTDVGTLLHAAIRGGQAECVRILLSHGADPNARDQDGKSARDLATGSGVEGLF